MMILECAKSLKLLTSALALGLLGLVAPEIATAQVDEGRRATSLEVERLAPFDLSIPQSRMDELIQKLKGGIPLSLDEPRDLEILASHFMFSPAVSISEKDRQVVIQYVNQLSLRDGFRGKAGDRFTETFGLVARTDLYRKVRDRHRELFDRRTSTDPNASIYSIEVALQELLEASLRSHLLGEWERGRDEWVMLVEFIRQHPELNLRQDTRKKLEDLKNFSRWIEMDGRRNLFASKVPGLGDYRHFARNRDVPIRFIFLSTTPVADFHLDSVESLYSHASELLRHLNDYLRFASGGQFSVKFAGLDIQPGYVSNQTATPLTYVQYLSDVGNWIGYGYTVFVFKDDPSALPHRAGYLGQGIIGIQLKSMQTAATLAHEIFHSFGAIHANDYFALFQRVNRAPHFLRADELPQYCAMEGYPYGDEQIMDSLDLSNVNRALIGWPISKTQD
jgi:hypothetical protein